MEIKQLGVSYLRPIAECEESYVGAATDGELIDDPLREVYHLQEVLSADAARGVQSKHNIRWLLAPCCGRREVLGMDHPGLLNTSPKNVFQMRSNITVPVQNESMIQMIN